MARAVARFSKLSLTVPVARLAEGHDFNSMLMAVALPNQTDSAGLVDGVAVAAGVSCTR